MLKTKNHLRKQGSPLSRASRRHLVRRGLFAGAAVAIFAAQASTAAIYPDKFGNPGDIVLEDPIVSSIFGGVDYTVPYTTVDSEGFKSGEYHITSEQLPGRDIDFGTLDSVLHIMVTDSTNVTAAKITYRNNAMTAPAMPILTLYDCASGDCVEVAVYDDPKAGPWIISDQYDTANYPIELLDARVALGLLDDYQLLQLPNTADGTGDWDAFMRHHIINIQESKFRGDVDTLGDDQSELLTDRMIAEIEDKNDCSYNDWLVRHWCTEASCPPGVGITHRALTFLTDHATLIEAMSETLFNEHYNDWPTSGSSAYAFPYGRMPMWHVDHDQEHGGGTPCGPGNTDCHMLPLHWERVIDGNARVHEDPGNCEATPIAELGVPGCYHDLPTDAYMPTLLPTPGGFTEPGQTAHLGQVECAEIVGPDGFVDRPCTVATDYDAVMDTMEVVYHNELHRFIGGGFGPPAATSGTMVFWAFHTQVSTNMLSNLRHTQKRDMGVPVATCNGQTYEAEDIFKSTGGPATDGWNIWDNGFISTDHTFAPGYTEINVVARGDAAFGVWPHMVVTVDGEVVGDVNVTTAGWSTYTFAFNATAGNQQIRVAFDNDVYAPPFADRNLIVDALYIDCVEPPPPAGDPCASFCAGPDEITWEGSYQSGDLGTGTTCRQTTQEAVGINCSNFTGGKQLSINGVPMTCNNQNQLLPTPVDGGYCIQSTAGDYSWASYALW